MEGLEVRAEDLVYRSAPEHRWPPTPETSGEGWYRLLHRSGPDTQRGGALAWEDSYGWVRMARGRRVRAGPGWKGQDTHPEFFQVAGKRVPSPAPRNTDLPQASTTAVRDKSHFVAD